jgi:hypothetical protein
VIIWKTTEQLSNTNGLINFSASPMVFRAAMFNYSGEAVVYAAELPDDPYHQYTNTSH